MVDFTYEVIDVYREYEKQSPGGLSCAAHNHPALTNIIPMFATELLYKHGNSSCPKGVVLHKTLDYI